MSDTDLSADAPEVDDEANERTELLREGDEKYEADEFEAAIDCYDRAIELDPEDASGYYKRGRAYSSLAQHLQIVGEYEQAPPAFEQAFADLTRAIELEPDHALAYYKRATAYEMSGQPERSLPDFDRAAELDPEYRRTFRNRGNAHLKLEEFEKAVEDYTRTLELKPDSEHTYSNRGTARAKLGQYEEALADFTEAIDLAPDYLPAYLNRVELHLKRDDPERALADAKEVRDLGEKPEVVALGLLFGIISKLLLGEDVSEETTRYREVCSRDFGTRWSSQNVESWLDSAELASETEARIREAVDRMPEHVDEDLE
jgi:tetratricopeptide (TPR) repeat protein